MTINNMDQYIKSLWDWAFLDKCFRYGIKVTDIDGCVERKHNLLFLETKLPKVKIPYGQQRLFTNLAMYHHVIIIWGEKNIPEKDRIFECNRCVAKRWDRKKNKPVFKQLVFLSFQI